LPPAIHQTGTDKPRSTPLLRFQSPQGQTSSSCFQPPQEEAIVEARARIVNLAMKSEEFAIRGYPQLTLTHSVGFWPAAIITSLILGVAHVGNSGE
jgi:hypothetical protein